MRRKFLPSILSLLIGLTLLVIAGTMNPDGASRALAGGTQRGEPGRLFANEYVPPVGPNGVGAQMYLCPRPTPPLVGHTYITYQPLMPHQFLYRHQQDYQTRQADGSTTYTHIRWR
jgi:hypothetical protein